MTKRILGNGALSARQADEQATARPSPLRLMQKKKEKGRIDMFTKKFVLLGAAAAVITVATMAFAAIGDVTFEMVEEGPGIGGDTFFAINRHNDSHTNGAVINLWTLTGHSSQKWRWNGQTLRSKTNDQFCLNLHNNTHANGATVNLWTCNGHASQNWIAHSDDTLRPASNDDFCVNLHNNDRQNGGTINLWTCNNHESQDFEENVETIVVK